MERKIVSFESKIKKQTNLLLHLSLTLSLNPKFLHENQTYLHSLTVDILMPFGGGPKKDIVDTAVEAGSFKTLLTAVQKAGLVETLKGDGPFTLFASSDQASRISGPDFVNLLKPENKDKLELLLTYHRCPARLNRKKQ